MYRLLKIAIFCNVNKHTCFAMNSDLYQQHILDHYKRPRNFGEAGDGAVCSKGSNPSCGDELTFCIETDENIVKKVTFTGQGCAISLAAASMLTEKLTNASLVQVQRITEVDMYAMLGVTVSSGREKCALLAYRALMDVLKSYELRCRSYE